MLSARLRTVRSWPCEVDVFSSLEPDGDGNSKAVGKKSQARTV